MYGFTHRPPNPYLYGFHATNLEHQVYGKPPQNKLDLLHPYYRKRAAKYVIPLIYLGSAGFMVWTVWYFYFKKENRESWKSAWLAFLKNAQGGFIGGFSFAVFLAILISVSLWWKGKSFKKAFNYFVEKFREAAAVERFGEITAGMPVPGL